MIDTDTWVSHRSKEYRYQIERTRVQDVTPNLMHDGFLQVADGELSAGNYSQFNMDGLEAGACYSVMVKSGRIKYLEILLNGEGFWDGRETTWTICDPDTGHFP